MKIPYLGPISLSWCRACNVPVLAERCGVCGGPTEKVPVTPPGDIRPAFERDIELINEAAISQFGSPLIKDERVVLLNSVPGFDRFDEVIVDGVVAGALRYDVKRLCYEFMPGVEGGNRIWNGGGKGFVRVAVDAAAFILRGASVLMPGVVDFDREIQAGQEVLVVCEDSVIAVGKTRFSGEEAAKARKGMFVKVRRRLVEDGAHIPEGGQGWGLVVEANREVIERYEKEALQFIRRSVERKDLPVVVSFSGGKDSLATLLLVRKVVEPKVLFVDTGVEFPETTEYVERMADALGLDLIITRAGDRFWKGLSVFGMSGRDYRWCCKVCKLGPVAKVMDERFPQGVLNFIGQRRYESLVRSRSRRMWRNRWLPRQLCASPIQSWSALHVWLYLMKEGVDVNPLYHRGLERIGCWPCPSSSLAEVEALKELYPGLWQGFVERLSASGLSDEEIKYGFWRWQHLPKGQQGLAEELAVAAGRRRRGRSLMSPDRERARNIAGALGTDVTEDVIARSTLCLGCGVCLGHCEHGAIEFRGGRVWLNSRCRGCGRCHGRCPIVKYLYEKNIINNHDS